MSDRKTPRTDMVEWAIGNKPITPREKEILDFVRALERECEELRKQVVRLLDDIDEVNRTGVKQSKKNANAMFIDTRAWQGMIMSSAIELRRALAERQKPQGA